MGGLVPPPSGAQRSDNFPTVWVTAGGLGGREPPGNWVYAASLRGGLRVILGFPAEVAELVDAPDSKSGGCKPRVGSIPTFGIAPRRLKPLAFRGILPPQRNGKGSSGDEGGSVRKRFLVGVVAAIGVLSVAMVAYGSAGKSALSPLPSSSCPGKLVQGGGTAQFIIASGPAAAGLEPDADDRDDEGDPVPAPAEQVQGGQVRRRLPVLRRLDRSGRQVGLRQVLGERAELRPQQGRDRRARHVQLRLCGDRGAGGQPGIARLRQPREHVRGPDAQCEGRDLGGRARQVLPDRQAELHPRRRGRRLPGCG